MANASGIVSMKVALVSWSLVYIYTQYAARLGTDAQACDVSRRSLQQASSTAV